MYASRNFQSKKSLKEAVKAGIKVRVTQPGRWFANNVPENGNVCIEGPWYPKPHRWYASVKLKDGLIVEVK